MRRSRPCRWCWHHPVALHHGSRAYERCPRQNSVAAYHAEFELLEQNGGEGENGECARAQHTKWVRSCDRLTWPSSRAFFSFRSEAGKLRSWLPCSMVVRLFRSHHCREHPLKLKGEKRGFLPLHPVCLEAETGQQIVHLGLVGHDFLVGLTIDHRPGKCRHIF